MTTNVQRRCRDNTRLSRQQLLSRHVATTQRFLRQELRQEWRQEQMSRQHQYTGPVHSSPKECIGIRAQLRNPINKQLPRRKRQAVGDAERKIWVAEGFISFFFFSFLLFYFFFFFCFRRYRLDYFHLSFFIFFYFLDLDVIVLSRS